MSGDDPRERRTAFVTVADEYDRGRPDHPDGVFDALGDLTGLRIADVGAGTGIATRPLIARGAHVIAVDPAVAMLARAVARSPGLDAVIADGVDLPFPDASLDVVTFGQSWHWLDPERRVTEMHRVLRARGRWAAWWTHARGADWMDRYWDCFEAACPGVHRDQRDTDWGAAVAANGRFTVEDRVTVAWTRTVTVEHALTDHASHSYVAALPPAAREAVLAAVAAVYHDEFPGGVATIPQETWLWIGHRLDR